MDRRSFMRWGTLTAGGLWLGSTTSCSPAPSYVPPSNGTPFTLGVVSGLHSSSEVVLWTRLDAVLAPGAGNVIWQIATDPAMSSVVDAGPVAVGPDADWTAKVLVGGLEPARSYWYRFLVDGVASPTGRAVTLPPADSDPTSLRLVAASCQNWGMGWYNAWSAIAEEDLDAVVWLGDYIYESSGRNPLSSVRDDPTEHADDLDTYRAKYRLYRSDPQLQRGHGAHPLVPVWDDHEFANNFNSDTVASQPQRFADAHRAWMEYMPVWPLDGTRIYRSLRWGRLADLSMLDTRQYRDRQANGFQREGVEVYLGAGAVVKEANGRDRTILGADQRSWLLDRLSTAHDDDVRWKLVGNQVMISPLRIVDLDTELIRALNPGAIDNDGLYLNFDDWDSYQIERSTLLGHLANNNITGTSFLTGDVHAFWQSTLRADLDDPSSPRVANEFVCGSISSIGFNVAPYELSRALESAATQWSPPFRYSDHRNNGYGLVEITPDDMRVTFRVTEAADPLMAVRDSVAFRLSGPDPYPAFERLSH